MKQYGTSVGLDLGDKYNWYCMLDERAAEMLARIARMDHSSVEPCRGKTTPGRSPHLIRQCKTYPSKLQALWPGYLPTKYLRETAQRSPARLPRCRSSTYPPRRRPREVRMPSAAPEN